MTKNTRPVRSFDQLAPPSDGELQVVFATDAGYASRVEVAAFSLLRSTPCPIRIVLIGTPDLRDAFPRLMRVLPHFPNARLEQVFPAFLTEAAQDHEHHFLPPAAFGRMLVPHMMTGRVLYLDGDTLVRHDLSQARTLDLGGNLAAAARDVIVMRHALRVARKDVFPGRRHADAARRAKRSLRAFLQTGCNVDRYFNSGVMILDCDAMRADPDLLDAMLDFERARSFVTFDQDLINLLLGSRMHELDPSWNTWPRIGVTKHKPFQSDETAYFARARSDPKVVHYYGDLKPWGPWSYKRILRGYRWFGLYRQTERALNRLAAQAR